MNKPRQDEINSQLSREQTDDSQHKLILIVDDNEDDLHLMKVLLVSSGYRVIVAPNGRDAIRRVQESKPDLVFLDLVMPLMDGLEACATLKNNYETTSTPVIIISHKEGSNDIVKAFEAGADDYVVKPVKPAELLARLRANLRRTSREITANPLTRIPGINFFYQQVRKRLDRGEQFSLGICDIDNFKAYNDRYGFEAGDKVIKSLAQILRHNIDSADPENCLAHIGGDDFIFLCCCCTAMRICEGIITEFDAEVPGFYNEEERERGYILAVNRRGNLEYFPMMSLSIGLACTEDKNYASIAELVEIANEVKVFLKKSTVSNYMMNRRRFIE